MSAFSIINSDKAVRERADGIKEILNNHYRWLRYYTGVEVDPAGIVEVGESFREMTTIDRRELSLCIDRMESLKMV